MSQCSHSGLGLYFTQGTHSNSLFSLSDRKFSVPDYVMCDHYIHKTDLADLSRFQTKLLIFAANIFYL